MNRLRNIICHSWQLSPSIVIIILVVFTPSSLYIGLSLFLVVLQMILFHSVEEHKKVPYIWNSSSVCKATGKIKKVKLNGYKLFLIYDKKKDVFVIECFDGFSLHDYNLCSELSDVESHIDRLIEGAEKKREKGLYLKSKSRELDDFFID